MRTYAAKSPLVMSSRAVAFLVDDDPVIRDCVRLVLERGEYTVCTFASAREALEALVERGGDIAILISDVEMPVMDGISLACEVARRFPRIPILMISGLPLSDRAQLRCSFLQKPFAPRTLIEAARQVIGCGGSQAA